MGVYHLADGIPQDSFCAVVAQSASRDVVWAVVGG